MALRKEMDVGLSLVDTDLGRRSHEEPTRFMGQHEESVDCCPADLCLSSSLPPRSALGPGTDGCLQKVMEIRRNVALL